MHGPVPQASPPQPQVSHSITSAGTPSVARSAASLLQPHSERGVEPIRSGRFAALTGCQGVPPTRERCFLAARAGCGAATNSSHAFLGHFRRFCPIYSHNMPAVELRLRFRQVGREERGNISEQEIAFTRSATHLSGQSRGGGWCALSRRRHGEVDAGHCARRPRRYIHTRRTCVGRGWRRELGRGFFLLLAGPSIEECCTSTLAVFFLTF